MKARSLLLLVAPAALALVAPGSVRAQQPGPEAQQLPPGHPPIGDTAPAAQPGLPEGHPPISGSAMPAPPLTPAAGEDDEAAAPQALPPGHPPIGDGAPARMGPAGAPPISDDGALPAGSVVISVRNAAGQPVPNTELIVQVTRKTVAEGESRSERTLRTGPDGTARLDALSVGSDFIYQARAKYSAVEYGSPAFQLPPMAGKRISIQVYDATPDMDAPPVGVDSFIALEPREEFLQVEQLLRFVNPGQQTWLAAEIVVPLEPGYRAFTAEEDQGDIRISNVEGRGYRITGFARPGMTEASFRYQIPYGGSDTARFTSFMPPRVAHVRIVSAATGSMKMRVEGMPEPQLMRGDEGQRMLVTDRYVSAGDNQLDLATISIHGLPTPGPARWYAVAIAAGAVLIGLFLATKPSDRDSEAEERADARRARSLLLEELAALEEGRKSGEIGPKTYEHTRRNLIDSLARLIAVEKLEQQSKRADA